jgi:sulfatase maturation enzyme AslB (radical SAM superfamily)
MSDPKNDISKSFCVLPWIHSFINSDGNYQVCCTSEEHHRGIPDSEGKFYNIKDQPSQEEVMNSDFMKQVRIDMLNGKWNKVCARCVITEQSGGISRRIIENQEYERLNESIVKNTKEDGHIKIEFKTIDYRLGNLCNLECRMCGPHSSARWLKDWNTVKPEPEQINEALREKYENFDWIEKDYLLGEFKEKLQHVEKLHFAGGEPLFTPQMAQMLKFCVDMDVAKNIILSYNTNVTTLPPAVLELWKEFKGVRLLCSIDGFDKVNEYVRYPSKWKVIDQNLTFLDENFETYKIQEILLSCTVQVYNVLQIPDLYDYLKKFKNIVPAINLINLHIPFYLRTTVLPIDSKAIAELRLLKIYEELEKTLPDRYKYLLDNIHQIINFMKEEDMSKYIPLFLKVNLNIDKAKGIHFKDYIPELYDVVAKNVLANAKFEKIE